MTKARRGTDTISAGSGGLPRPHFRPFQLRRKKNKRMRKLASTISCKDPDTLYSLAKPESSLDLHYVLRLPGHPCCHTRLDGAPLGNTWRRSRKTKGGRGRWCGWAAGKLGQEGSPGLYEDSADITGDDLTWPLPKSPPKEMRKGDKSHLPNSGWRVAGAGQSPSGSTGMDARRCARGRCVAGTGTTRPLNSTSDEAACIELSRRGTKRGFSTNSGGPVINDGGKEGVRVSGARGGEADGTVKEEEEEEEEGDGTVKKEEDEEGIKESLSYKRENKRKGKHGSYTKDIP
ncbi:hypothetical protein E2C01_040767 [Portunus trituberculatus]|uniref:Uncharacterized protein n=1 Tax=Portunus trituberculatus TaxID=210409 RepID=A0A5B7FRN1_PORTR|nr:hypothetical protein [Portunus trituberculatus]